MTTQLIATLRALADDAGVTDGEWANFRMACHPEARAFYVSLRKALSLEFAQGRPFYLPSREMAERQFITGRRDRKFYLQMTNELKRLGLIERVKGASFAEDGSRSPALWMFTNRIKRPDNLVFLAAHRTHRRLTMEVN